MPVLSVSFPADCSCGWLQLGQVLGRMVAEDTIPFKPVAHSIQEAGTGPDAEESLVDNGAASTLLGSLLQQLAQSEADVQSIWASSGLQLSQFFMVSQSVCHKVPLVWVYPSLWPSHHAK